MNAIRWLAALALLLTAAPVMAGEWTATQVKQPARYTTNSKTWTTIRRGMTLPSSSWVHTGRGGRLKLNRGRETIRFSPNTLVAIKKRRWQRMTRLEQRSGSVRVKVNKRARPHMQVRNRYMTAVVKGTTFRVSMNGRGGKVTVSSGLVGVSNAAGASMDVGRGQYAAVSSSGALTGTGTRGGARARAKRYNGSVPGRARATLPAAARATRAPTRAVPTPTGPPARSTPPSRGGNNVPAGGGSNNGG